jgi:hypothetical protein
MLTRDDLLREGALEKKLFPADYGDVEADFAGAINVEPLDLEGIRRALGAYELFREVSSYPQTYAEDLRHAESLMGSARSVAKVVSLRQEGGAARLTAGGTRHVDP